jgi:hypothetical protein
MKKAGRDSSLQSFLVSVAQAKISVPRQPQKTPISVSNRSIGLQLPVQLATTVSSHSHVFRRPSPKQWDYGDLHRGEVSKRTDIHLILFFDLVFPFRSIVIFDPIRLIVDDQTSVGTDHPLFFFPAKTIFLFPYLPSGQEPRIFQDVCGFMGGVPSHTFACSYPICSIKPGQNFRQASIMPHLEIRFEYRSNHASNSEGGFS